MSTLQPTKPAEALVQVQDLRIRFPSRSGTTEAVKGIDFEVGREKLGIVGESGSGKSITCRALLGLVPPPARVTTPASGRRHRCR